MKCSSPPSSGDSHGCGCGRGRGHKSAGDIGIVGTHYMKYSASQQGEKRLAKDIPVLEASFEKKLTLCQNYIRMNKTIRAYYVFDGNNVLANDGPLREQASHTDYQKYPRNK